MRDPLPALRGVNGTVNIRLYPSPDIQNPTFYLNSNIVTQIFMMSISIYILCDTFETIT